MSEENDLVQGIIDSKIVALNKIVKKLKTSGAIYVPKKFIGKEVLVIIKIEN